MKKLIKDYSGQILLAVILITLILSNFLIQGITCNDEAVLRLCSQHGIREFLHMQIVEEALHQGRILAVLAELKYLTFISSNIFIFRTIDILIILFTILVFGQLVYKYTRDKRLTLLSLLLTLSFIPITFEHAVPNAFVCVVCQPTVCLLSSLILFLDYLDKEKKSTLVFSCILFFWGCCLYEFIVTYTVAFIVIPLLKKDFEKGGVLKGIVKYSKSHVITALIYLIIYALQRMIFPSLYGGTQIRLTQPLKIIKVLAVEWLSAIPGYYLTNPKYRYIYSIYRPEASVPAVLMIIIFVLCFGYICSMLLFRAGDGQKRPVGRKKTLLILLMLFYTVIPVLPNAITELYQETVSTGNFTSIPVSFPLYLAMMFLVTVLMEEICKKTTALKCIAAAILVILGTGIFYTNTVVAAEQYRNYNRFVAIEEMLASDYWQQFDSLAIMAPNFYETKNNLAVREGHWTDFAQLRSGKDIAVQSDGDAYDCFIEIQDDNSFNMTMNGKEYRIIRETGRNHSVPFPTTSENSQSEPSLLTEIWKDGRYTFYEVN